MSNHVTLPTQLLDLLPVLSGAEVKVMLVIVHYISASETSRSFISLTQLQDDTGLSRQAVVNAVNGLLALAVVIVTKHGERGVREFALGTIR